MAVRAHFSLDRAGAIFGPFPVWRIGRVALILVTAWRSLARQLAWSLRRVSGAGLVRAAQADRESPSYPTRSGTDLAWWTLRLRGGLSVGDAVQAVRIIGETSLLCGARRSASEGVQRCCCSRCSSKPLELWSRTEVG